MYPVHEWLVAACSSSIIEFKDASTIVSFIRPIMYFYALINEHACVLSIQTQLSIGVQGY